MNIRVFAAAALAALAACASTIVEPAPDRSSMTTADGRPAVLLVSDPDDWPHDRYEFLGMQLTGDMLDVSIRYGGGCATHEFALLVIPVFLESYPVQMNGTLAHDAHDDPCDALVETALRLDLSPLRVAYRKAYGRSSDTVVLSIAGWPEPVRYSF